MLGALAAAACKPTFRLVHYSVQSNHVHLLVEAESRTALIRGVQGLAIRLARGVNRTLGRTGAVWSDRCHAHVLRTPAETRRALVYVLQNARKHGYSRPGVVDPCSSGAWFGGWEQSVTRPLAPSPVAPARTRLLAVGWRRYGPVDVREQPRAARRERRRRE